MIAVRASSGKGMRGGKKKEEKKKKREETKLGLEFSTDGIIFF